MVQFNFTYDPSISLEQRVGFELAAAIWSTYLTDDITVSLHIGSSNSLGADGSAVGGAVPMFYEQNYGVYQAYAAADATTSAEGDAATIDEQALESLQIGNTADFVVNGEIVDGNSEILLTSAQAKALGMDEAIALDNGTTWDRDLIDNSGLDGYILVGNQYEWSYDYTRENDAPEGTLDFLSMAMHEIGHTLGFFSGLDGSLDTIDLHSGETQLEDFSVLDLYRHSLNASSIENPDGTMSDLTVGENSYFSLDGGVTNLANFATGIMGDGYQASHWKRLEKALGIMDPTLAYKERLTLSELDLQTMDVLGYDINYAALETELDLDALLLEAEATAAADLNIETSVLSENRGSGENGDLYSLSYSEWWSILESHILDLGYGELFQLFEIGYGELFQQHEAQYSEGGRLFALGYGELFQAFEETILALGYGELFQSFEADLLALGYGELFQIFEQGYGKLFQSLEPLFATLDYVENAENVIDAPSAIDFSGIPLFSGGADDDIIGGSFDQDRVDGGLGDDLIDGKAGDDLLSGSAGRDIIYGAEGSDIIYGGNDDDRLLGEDGNDQIFGDEGHDILSGGFGHDVLAGGTGRDELKGASGHDVLSGGAGDDVLAGEAGSDLLMGEAGADTLSGGAGNDILYGDEVLAETQAALNVLRQNLVEAAVIAGDSSGDEPASLSASELIDTNGFIRIEAEKLSLSNGFYIEENGLASSDRTVATNANTIGSALTNFAGPTGRYMVVVHYLDESDGQTTATIKIGGEAVDSWQFSQDNNLFVSRTVTTDITIQTGDVIELLSSKEGEEIAQIDYIDLIPLDNILTTSVESAAPVSLLSNTTFESGLVGWMEGTDLSLIEDAETGNHVLKLGSASSSTGQNVQLEGGGLYTLSAEALATGEGWSGFGITFMDENWETIEQRVYSVNSSEWTTYGGTIMVSGDARYANVWISRNSDDGDFLLDDVSLILGASVETQVADTVSSGSSILQNGDFASPLGNDNWQIWSGSGEISAEDAYQGTALVLSGIASAGQLFDATVGEVYELSFAAKTTSSGWDGVGIDFYDVNGDKIGSNGYRVTSSDWTSYKQQIVAPEGAARGGIWLVKSQASDQFFLDEVALSVVESSVLANSTTESLQEGLIAHVALNEAAGETPINNADGTGLSTQNITESNWVEGKSGNALRFLDSSESIQIQAGEQIQSGVTDEVTDADFSVAFWLKPEAGPTGTFRTVINKWSSDRTLGLWLDKDSNRLNFGLSTTSSQDIGNYSQAELAINQWSHVTYTKSGQQLSLYINGQLDSSITLHGQALMPEGLLEVGKTFQGAVDDIYLYDRAIDLADIHTLSGYQADVLEGGLGSDQLFGGEGNDTLDGTDGINAGRGEIDILSGGRGRDRFILGSAQSVYYADSDVDALPDDWIGLQDYAAITDFEEGVDIVQLHGSAASYSLSLEEDSSGVSMRLSFGNDAVAVFKGVDSLDLSSSSFEFVGEPTPVPQVFVW